MIDGISIIISSLTGTLLLMFVLVVRLGLMVRRLRTRCRDCGTPMLAEYYCPRCEADLLEWMG